MAKLVTLCLFGVASLAGAGIAFASGSSLAGLVLAAIGAAAFLGAGLA